MNHKILVQEALDGKVSFQEAAEMIANEMDSLRESFLCIVEGAIVESQKESEDIEQQRSKMNVSHANNLIAAMGEHTYLNGITCVNIGDRQGTAFPFMFTFDCSNPNTGIINKSIFEDFKYTLLRNIYEQTKD